MISLQVASTPASLEAFLGTVRANPDQSLRLPVKVDRGGVFGFSALAIQVILTWARLQTENRVIQLAPSFTDDPMTRARFSGSAYGMTALYLAQEVRSGDNTVSRAEALRGVAPFVDAMQRLDYRSTVRGTGALLCCFQGARNEFLSALYSRKQRGTQEYPTVRPLSTLNGVIRNMLDAAQDGLSGRLEKESVDALSNLVYQLFNNADIHTVTNASGDVYDLGVRGIQIRTHRYIQLEEMNEYVQGDASLAHYLRKVAMQTPNRNEGLAKKPRRRGSTFVELSIFDSGPGLALRWLASKIGKTSYSGVSEADEVEAIRKCFELHSTTGSSGHVGDGLVIAMRAMRQLKAFMALRSGRLSLLQDFSSKEHADFSPKHRFVDTPLLNEIAGASYTICFPVPN